MTVRLASLQPSARRGLGAAGSPPPGPSPHSGSQRLRHRTHLGKQSEGVGHQGRFAGDFQPSFPCLILTVTTIIMINSVPLHQTFPFHELERAFM